MYGRSILRSNKLREVTYAGKVIGANLIVSANTFIRLKTDMYNGKEGFFSVKNGLVYRFVPIPDVFEYIKKNNVS